MTPKPETYNQFCERMLPKLSGLDKYKWGEFAFIAGQTSGMKLAENIIKGEETEDAIHLVKGELK